jgi:putative ATP-dependent endonuclease of OLD family
LKISKIHVKNFRCLEDVELRVDDLTVLLGANNAGKSTLLRALEFFFEGTALSSEDVYGDCEAPVSVQIVFSDLNAADREVLGKYAMGDQVVLTRTWTAGDMKLSGTANRFPLFDGIKAATGREKTQKYRELRDTEPALELPAATSMSAVDQAMLTWEMEHPDRCEPSSDEDASNLFGYQGVGQRRLEERFKFVFVPGLRDATAEAVERKGTLLSRLLTAIADQRAHADEQLAALEETTRQKYQQVISESHGPTLNALAERLTERMRRYVPAAGIALLPSAPEFQISPPIVELRGGESHDLTALVRQGHGFQRTFIIAVLEYLAEAATDNRADDKPTLFLAIEEPELYQHPPRARHFARTLRALVTPPSAVQVAYATHSPYFVSAEDFESLRIFRRIARTEDLPPRTKVNLADVPTVMERLPERQRNQPQRMLARTLSETFREAFFSRAVLLVEGPTDAAVFGAVAEKLERPLVAHGVVSVHVGKGAIPIGYAILASLGIPTFVVFDADGEATDRDACQSCGRGGSANRTAAGRSNEAILRSLGEQAEEFPAAGVRDEWACFEHCLEGAFPGLADAAATHAETYGWAPKSPEAYAEAVAQMQIASVPEDVQTVVTRVLELAEQLPED